MMKNASFMVRFVPVKRAHHEAPMAEKSDAAQRYPEGLPVC